MMIIEALSEMQDPNGSEIGAICKFIEVSGKSVISIGLFYIVSHKAYLR